LFKKKYENNDQEGTDKFLKKIAQKQYVPSSLANK
jgi:hypothetical protein